MIRTIETHQLDELDRHPVITAINKEIEESRGQWQEVVGPPPAQLANDVDDSSSDTGVFVGVHQTFLDLGPCCAEGLRVDEGEAVEGHERLLPDIGVTMAHPGKQVLQRG